MNEVLRFSWGHIFAFLAVIFIGYMTFMGAVYMQGGQGFGWALGVALLVCVLLLLTFLGLQWFKASSRKFGRRIVSERILLFASPVILAVLLFPFSHFWHVRTRSGEIVGDFRNAVMSSSVIFDEYGSYASRRTGTYNQLLDSLYTAGKDRDFQALGWSKEDATDRKTAMEKTLRLQLLPEKYDSLRSSALRWIAKADDGASVWNIFLLGNVGRIKEAIGQWGEALQELSTPVLSSETYNGIHTVQPFDSAVGRTAIEALENISPKFKQIHWLYNWVAFLCFPFLLLFLLTPYLIQERHSKNVFRVFSRKKHTDGEPVYSGDHSEDNSGNDSRPNSGAGQQRLDDYQSFTL